MKRAILSIFASACLASIITPATGVTRYKITDLIMPDTIYSKCFGVNEAGQAVGLMETEVSRWAFFYDNGEFHNLGTLGGSMSTATSINNNGQIAGYAQISVTNKAHAFLWEDGVMSDLGTLGGDGSYAWGINDSGQVAGQSWLQVAGTTRVHSFLYDNGVMQDLGTLPGDNTSEAYAINELGQIIGQSWVIYGRESAFLWSDGVMSDLGTLGGSDSEAWGINDRGQIVGIADDDQEDEMPFLWLPQDAYGLSAGMHNLDTLGATNGRAQGINNRGQVVGRVTVDGRRVAFIWEDGVMYNLNDLVDDDRGWRLEFANQISDSGYIVGFGHLGLGREKAFLLTPIPEPATTSLFVVGAALIAFRRKKAYQ